MQNFILITLILGLGFFLYLVQIGEIDSNDFSIRKLQGPARFEIVKSQASAISKSSTIKLDVKGTTYDIYTFTGSEFKHIPRSEYYMKIYNIPLEARDAVTGTWLGSRYTFYVVEEPIGTSKTDFIYHIYKTEYPTDSKDIVEYRRYKSIRGLDVRNTVEVRY
ncbi:MAG: hypothetical protein V4686_01215 [Patescibacteria group bacterium]